MPHYQRGKGMSKKEIVKSMQREGFSKKEATEYAKEVKGGKRGKKK